MDDRPADTSIGGVLPPAAPYSGRSPARHALAADRPRHAREVDGRGWGRWHRRAHPAGGAALPQGAADPRRSGEWRRALRHRPPDCAGSPTGCAAGCRGMDLRARCGLRLGRLGTVGFRLTRLRAGGDPRCRRVAWKARRRRSAAAAGAGDADETAVCDPGAHPRTLRADRCRAPRSEPLPPPVAGGGVVDGARALARRGDAPAAGRGDRGGDHHAGRLAVPGRIAAGAIRRVDDLWRTPLIRRQPLPGHHLWRGFALDHPPGHAPRPARYRAHPGIADRRATRLGAGGSQRPRRTGHRPPAPLERRGPGRGMRGDLPGVRALCHADARALSVARDRPHAAAGGRPSRRRHDLACTDAVPRVFRQHLSLLHIVRRR